jgi:hypothetical protein
MQWRQFEQWIDVFTVPVPNWDEWYERAVCNDSGGTKPHVYVLDDALQWWRSDDASIKWRQLILYEQCELRQHDVRSGISTVKNVPSAGTTLLIG